MTDRAISVIYELRGHWVVPHKVQRPCCRRIGLLQFPGFRFSHKSLSMTGLEPPPWFDKEKRGLPHFHGPKKSTRGAERDWIACIDPVVKTPQTISMERDEGFSSSFRKNSKHTAGAATSLACCSIPHETGRSLSNSRAT